MEYVRRAIIMAAGTGSRMMPLTANIPKPLVSVMGKPMIETVIQGLRQNGINEVYIVTGHLREQFGYLEEKYPGVSLIYNPYYRETNNISSLYVARNYIENAMILDGDQMINNKLVLSPETERSGYNCVWTDIETKEWLLTVENGIVTKCSRSGGIAGWQLYSISRWTKEDGRKLRRHLEIEFEQKNHKQIYWDDVALFCYPEEYRLGIKPMRAQDVTEIDSLEELIRIDKTYEKYEGNAV